MEEQTLNPGLTYLCEECLSDYGFDEDSTGNFADGIENGDIQDEGHFSWNPCERCNCHLGGDRFAAHKWELGKISHYEICGDCLHLIANGTYPDNFIPCN